jgi:signal transduction histidine kinase
VLIDPMQPSFKLWAALGGVTSGTDPDLLGVVAAHLAYSIAAYVVLAYRLISPGRLTVITTWTDVLFGAAVALVAGATSGAFYSPFFTSAVVAAGLQTGFRRTMQVTVASTGLWGIAIVLSAPLDLQLYVMRPVTLVLIGYLVGYLGQRRMDLESELGDARTAEDRLRIARELHDGCAQVLAAVNLQLDNCCDLLRRGRVDEAVVHLRELQGSVNSEHDELRAYLHSLAGIGHTSHGDALPADTHFTLNVALEGSGELVEQVSRIIREGVTNVRRHAQASSAAIRAAKENGNVHITVDDDGIGFGDGAARPWSISTRAEELGGSLEIARDRGPGAHLDINLPAR